MGKSWGIFLFDGNNSFSSNQWIRTNINKNCLPPQNELHTANLCFTVVLNHIWGKFANISLFIKKSDYLRNKLRIQWMLVFLNNFCYGKSRGIFLFDRNNSFCSNLRSRKLFKKKVYYPQNEPHTAKLFFSFVLNHNWGKFTGIFSFYSINWLSQNDTQNYSES